MFPTSIPRIELGAELGRGAHSVVVRGVRGERTFAVKLPLDAGTEAERALAHRRFLREAAALARVFDPGLPRVMEVGRAGGVPYLIMEFAGGQSLAEHIARESLPEEQVVGLGYRLARALDAIHQAGLVHRDVKPENIVFDAASGNVRLVDLGSASLADGRSAPVGTRSYMAPELLDGTGRSADARSDLYALGCVLAQCLGAWRPGQAPASPLTAERLGALGVSRRTAQIIGSLVAADPDARPPSAAHVAAELAREMDAPAAAPEAPRARLLGRAAELEQMRRVWAQAQRGGRVLVVGGAPGMGKTSLLNAFLGDMAAAGTTVLRATCHPREPRSFPAIRQLIDQYLKECEALPATARARALASVRRIAGDLGPLLKLLSPTVARVFHDAPTIAASENAEQAFAEGLPSFLARLLEKIAPVIVSVDDAQWLDPSSARVLSRAVRELRPRTLLLLGVRTGEEGGGGAESFLSGLPLPQQRVDLTPLSDDSAVELARDYLGAASLSADVKTTLLHLSEGTPLRVLEVLRTLVDEGVLLPHWGEWRLDRAAVTEMHLPQETASLLRRRLAALPPEVRSVLVAAAAIGIAFEDELLLAAAGCPAGSVGIALAEALRSQIVEPAAPGVHRFVHHTVRDALLEDESGLPEIHQRLAEALDARLEASSGVAFEIEGSSPPGPPPTPVEVDVDALYRVALHFAAGVPGRTPARLAERNIGAGRAALARFDNERAVAFFRAADDALRFVGGAGLPPEVRVLLAEACLRLGAFDEAVTEFRRAIGSSPDVLVKAAALVRIAWLEDIRLDSTRAWRALEEAFTLLGESLPHESAGYAIRSVGGWVARSRPLRGVLQARSRGGARDEILCSLYFQASRVALSSGHPARIVLSTLRCLEPAERLGASAALAKSYLAYGFVLTVLGMPTRGAGYVERAEAVGKELRDPIVYSHALQMHSTIAAWGGRFQDALDAGSRCLLEYGHWRELGDFCLQAYTQYEMESIRGRDTEAWRWLELAILRVNQHAGAPVVSELLLLAARVALVTLGRDHDAERRLRLLARAAVTVPKDSGFYPNTFAPRVAVHVARMDLGPAFEALVNEFQSFGLNPRRVHIGVVEYYLQVAHARVHQCLRAPANARAGRVSSLRHALRDLRAAAKIPAFEAHARLIEGYDALFSGNADAAHEAIEAAERLARQETLPWVLYGVHRARAHLLRDAGLAAAAKDQAVLAESVALEHGSVYRARWVREEFALRPRYGLDASYVTAALLSDRAPFDETTNGVLGGSRARRQLRALLRISQARAQELAPDHQARVVVDELLQALSAARGFLFLQGTVAAIRVPTGAGDADAPPLELVAGRDAGGRDLTEPEDEARDAIRAALAAAPADVETAALRSLVQTTARLSAVSAPLVVDDQVVGTVYLDRPLSEGVFSEADGELLAALAGQVSVALELTRTLRARERAQENLRNVEKMDAVARLGRGIAHDLNNMLSAIRMATVAMTSSAEAEEFSDDIRTIQSALSRANELTKQLGTFSQGELTTSQPIKLRSRIERLLPVITGLVGDAIHVDVRFGRAASILGDPAQVDQILMNLAINARDAIVGSGTISIATSEVTFDDAYLREHPRVKPGTYVCLTVTDTGEGMEEEVRQKIFEPYFTTKRERGGTGLGLASVYWIVSQAGGHIDVRTSLGQGTTFSLFFPKVEKPPPEERRRRPKRAPRETLLVVGADAPGALSLDTALAESGYRVYSAQGSREALDIVRRARSSSVDLLVADVVMPDMNGLELARELRKATPGLPVILLSGDAAGVLAERGILGGEVEFLARPLSPEDLVERVRSVLSRRRGPSS